MILWPGKRSVGRKCLPSSPLPPSPLPASGRCCDPRRHHLETTLLKREGGSAFGERGKWYHFSSVRAALPLASAGSGVSGVVTTPRWWILFYYGCQLCSCHFLYTLYLPQPIFVAKKRHSVSQTPGAMLMGNAHALHHHETGKWALPWDPRRSRVREDASGTGSGALVLRQ